MTQNQVKKALAYAAAVVAAFLAAVAGGALKVPPTVVQWVSFAGVVLGIFGASPIGRVVGTKELRLPVKAAPPLLDDSAIRNLPSPNDDVITADERPSGKLRPR
jgi:hypothetical protein